MAENDQQELTPMLIMKTISQTPIPSHGLTLKKLSEGHLIVSAIRNRRTVSEQINRHDR
jgi:hypothetical protein